MSLDGPEEGDPLAFPGGDASGRDRLAPADLPGLQRGELDAGERERHPGQRNGVGGRQPLGREMASKRFSVTASEAENTPIRDRRRAARWAPQPSFSPSSLAIERM